MKLIGSLTSPFVRKVRIVLAEKQIDYTWIEDSPWTEETHVPDHNPLGKIPVLVLDNASTLFDSRVIVEYLDMLHSTGSLIPEHKWERIQVKRWEALADGIADAAATIFIEKKLRPIEQQSPEWFKRQFKKMSLGCEVLSQELNSNTWFCNETFGLSDIAVGTALGYLDLRFPEFDWRTPYPNLARLVDQQLSNRVSFRDTAPPKVA